MPDSPAYRVTEAAKRTENKVSAHHDIMISATIPPAEQLLRMPAVCARTGLHRATIYELMARDAFPSSRRIGDRAVVWLASEVTAWMQALPINTAGSRAGSRSAGNQNVPSDSNALAS